MIGVRGEQVSEKVLKSSRLSATRVQSHHTASCKQQVDLTLPADPLLCLRDFPSCMEIPHTWNIILSDPTRTPAQEHSTSRNSYSHSEECFFIKLVEEIGLQFICSVLPLTLGSRHEDSVEKTGQATLGYFNSGSAARRREKQK